MKFCFSSVVRHFFSSSFLSLDDENTIVETSDDDAHEIKYFSFLPALVSGN